MWVVALIGMATAFIGSTLAQVYKIKDGEQFRGGPAYYMEKALGTRKLGIVFAILLTLAFGFIFNSVQSNTIAQSVGDVFDIPNWVVGASLVVLAAIVIFGGVRRIAHVTQVVVPVMATAYLLVVLYISILNFSEIPAVF